LVVTLPLHVVVKASLAHFIHLVVIITPFVLLSLSVKVVSHLTPSPILLKAKLTSSFTTSIVLKSTSATKSYSSIILKAVVVEAASSIVVVHHVVVWRHVLIELPLLHKLRSLSLKII
jgi:hypothetical protein